MKVYVLVENSSGEVRNSLDRVLVFGSREEAQKALKESYEQTLKDVEGYDFDQNEFDVDSYSIIIDDDYWSIYEGTIFESEVK